MFDDWLSNTLCLILFVFHQFRFRGDDTVPCVPVINVCMKEIASQTLTMNHTHKSAYTLEQNGDKLFGFIHQKMHLILLNSQKINEFIPTKSFVLG